MIWKQLFGGGDQPAAAAARPQAEPPVPSWQAVNELERAMLAIPDSVEAEFAFARELLECDVLLATAHPPKQEGARILDEDETFQVVSVDNNSGGTAAALFTSEARLAEAFGAGAPYISMNGRVALQAVSQLGAIINPGGGLYVSYPPPVIDRILRGDI